MKTNKASSFKYSEALKELESITQFLENREIDLDEAIVKFDRGSELANLIEQHLKNAENKVHSIKSKS